MLEVGNRLVGAEEREGVKFDYMKVERGRFFVVMG
jgi:hypothetical protein